MGNDQVDASLQLHGNSYFSMIRFLDKWFEIFQAILLGIASGKNKIDNVFFDFLIHIYLTCRFLCFDDLGYSNHGLNGVGCSTNLCANNLLLVLK